MIKMLRGSKSSSIMRWIREKFVIIDDLVHKIIPSRELTVITCWTNSCRTLPLAYFKEETLIGKGKAPEPKRPKRTRHVIPASIEDRLVRLSTLYLLDREDRHEDKNNLWSDFRVVGSTGNLYTVKIGAIPSCDCPDFLKRDDVCKHMLFVMLKVLRRKWWRWPAECLELHYSFFSLLKNPPPSLFICNFAKLQSKILPISTSAVCFNRNWKSFSILPLHAPLESAFLPT